MNKLSSFLSGCAASASALIALTLLTGAKAPPTQFDEINVGRINIREPDGTLRMVISNRGQFPGAPWRGGEKPRPDRKDFAGMLFVNDEGTESGGLIQKGVIGRDGKPDSGLSLSFDRFRQDQVIQILHAEQGGQTLSQLAINDEPDSLGPDAMERTARFNALDKLDPAARRRAIEEMGREGLLPANRVRLGTTPAKASTLALSDAQGRQRLVLTVTPEGKPSIQFLDEQGKPVRSIDLETR
ncbi:MAG: hypothetical protein ACK4S6_11030 [Roseateles asaccharophilus]|uniref:Uncharacterized protein n=1 Tax=Roseateles asaccharophilus TaxID=582607 RepID=A0A4R6NC74_9BURK|nr:hypothetical protein [Roseateles asaccharophilus]MDN3545323.1 hypothetical protein [Roseateles asaccharophilus]TDP11290.1 hypothetical protein DFR39_103216 [Roseateles asaccharophilus]